LQARQHVGHHPVAASQKKCFTADEGRRCTQNTQIKTGWVISRGALDDARRMQCINYLKATCMQLYLLLDWQAASDDQRRSARPVKRPGPICVHPRASPSFICGRILPSFLPALPCNNLAMRTEVVRDRNVPSHDQSMHHRSE